MNVLFQVLLLALICAAPNARASEPIAVSPSDHFVVGNPPSVAMANDGNFVVAWTNQTAPAAVFAQRISAAGIPLGAVLTVSPSDHNVNDNPPSVAMDDKANFVVAWTNETAPFAVFARRFTAANSRLGAVLEISGTDYIVVNNPPAIAMANDGNFVVAWTNEGLPPFAVFARRFNAVGNPSGTVLTVSPSDHNVNSNPPSVAMADDGNFVVAWTNEDAPYAVFAQRFPLDRTAPRRGPPR